MVFTVVSESTLDPSNENIITLTSYGQRYYLQSGNNRCTHRLFIVYF